MEPVKPHVVCIPLPAQGPINPILKLAKLLHFKGFRITFVHTDFNYHRLLESRGLDSLQGSPDFRFETIIDGLPSTNPRGIQDLPDLCLTIPVEGLRSFWELIMKLKDVPPITSIISDGVMSFTLEVADEFGIPEMVLFTPSACSMLGYLHYEDLKERGYFPLKDASQLSNGYLDTDMDWIPAMKGVGLREFPTFIRTTNPNDTMFNYNLQSVNNATKAAAVILNTFDDLEHQVLDAIKTKLTNLYTIGPLSLLHRQLCPTNLDSMGSNLWEEDTQCLSWLDEREPCSVVYVNFGSLITVTPQKLRDFAWELADSKYPFLWVIRADLVNGGGEDILSEEFLAAISDRGVLVGWCPQERVLSHPSVGGFLTHCGWNSTMESVCEGVPLICWPFFADQPMNCFYCCREWGIGMEMDSDVNREKVEILARELMEGMKGHCLRVKAMDWKKKAEAATTPGGSSYINFDNIVMQLKQE
ncbi:7-deoxyloganetin glucosyltransferase [Hibiscus syriacus]|uniref:Glycosyltransferase n=1 Tax=Hibiscus syriacus TaxID=106335 RepID=A0A6A2Y4Y5_HIBSY|nr:7-deoxyloganetin glucosyltransferase-like [Hibiscus syriacus]KAE8663774.1 7-deoxyloganetin glucosyltransferase [Hibiscus syriacus]